MSIKRKDRTQLRRCVWCGVVRIDPRGWRTCPMCPFSESVPVTEDEYRVQTRAKGVTVS